MQEHEGDQARASALGEVLVGDDDRPGGYLLGGEKVEDGVVMDLLTDDGWVRGHFRSQRHPDTGAVAFEMHVTGADGLDQRIEHRRGRLVMSGHAPGHRAPAGSFSPVRLSGANRR